MDLPPISIIEATEAAIEAADHLTLKDYGAVQVLRDLAVKIAVMDDYFDALYEGAVESRGKPPSQDNVSIPTYLKICDSLGLTPSGRKAFDAANRRQGSSATPSLGSTSDELGAKRNERTWRRPASGQ